ncbi:MAG TPA: glycosyltransferase family 4 protein [Candidatus Paceibacterota bacterium]|nr:glycosyltransferase family 4 protein [Candidatus Paceibacterota bacterium]
MPQNQSKRKKLVYLITKANWGGAQRYVYDLAAHFCEDFDVLVLYGEKGLLAEKLEEKNIRVREISGLRRDVGLLSEIHAFWEIWKILREEQPDIFHVNSSKAGIMGTLAGRLIRVPRIIFTAHGWAFTEDRSIFSRAIIFLLHVKTILLSHVTIAVSQTTKEEISFVPFLGKKIVVIRNGIPAEGFLGRSTAQVDLQEKFPQLQKIFESGTLIFGSVAELHPNKNLALAVRAVVEIIRNGAKTALVVIGEGEERARLEALAAELRVQDHVFFPGKVEFAHRYLKAFDVFVLPSKKEGLPYVLLEAGVAGLPMVASGVGGIGEIIVDQRTGLLFPSDDAKKLESCMLSLLKNPAQREKYAEAAQKNISENFSLEKMLTETRRVYEDQ